MGAKRGAFVLLLAPLVGFALGSVMLGYLALLVGFSLIPSIHSDLILLVLFGALACFILGGTAGAKGAVRLADSWYGSEGMTQVLGLRQTPFFRWRDCKECADGDENDGCRDKGDGRTGEVGKQA